MKTSPKLTLDKSALGRLIVEYEPRGFVRATPLVHRATPLGMGFGAPRYASPDDAFKVLYIAENLVTSVAETVIRDRFEGRKQRRLQQAEVEDWGATEVAAVEPLVLVDLRTTALVELGVSTDAGRAKAQTKGRALSQAIYDQSRADGILYRPA